MFLIGVINAWYSESDQNMWVEIKALKTTKCQPRLHPAAQKNNSTELNRREKVSPAPLRPLPLPQEDTRRRYWKSYKVPREPGTAVVSGDTGVCPGSHLLHAQRGVPSRRET